MLRHGLSRLILTKVVVEFASAAFKRKPRPLGLPRGGDVGSVEVQDTWIARRWSNLSWSVSRLFMQELRRDDVSNDAISSFHEQDEKQLPG
jgi:hypothetical protein